LVPIKLSRNASGTLAECIMRYLGLNSFNYNIIMARFLDPTYDPRQDSGTSGGDTSDSTPRTRI
jgi:hypothetical protein